MKPEEPQIAILGLGSRSTLFYLETLNSKYQEHFGDYHTFPCLVYNVDFNTINPFLPNTFEVLILQLTHYLNALFKFPIQRCIIPNITLHETFDRACLKNPILHPVHLTIAYLKRNDIKNVVIFGSKYTMETDYVSSQLICQNIQVNIPETEDLLTIDLIRQKIYNHTERGDDVKVYKELIIKYSEKTHVLVACTELSILTSEINPIKPVIDMAILQINEALRLAFAPF